MRMKTGPVAWLAYLPAALLLGLLRVLPRPAVRQLGRSLGWLIYRIDKSHRKVAESNLATAFGSGCSETERKHIMRSAFLHFGTSFFDLVYLAYLRPEKRDRVIQVQGEENLRQALSKGQGALIVTGHYGLWEIAQIPLNRIAPLNVVARPLDNPYMEKALLKMRGRLGSQVISKFKASREILKSLRANESVAILIDQNVQIHESVFVDFFGKQAATTPSLAMFHLRTGAPIIPIFCAPTPSKDYLLKILPPVVANLTGERDSDIKAITQACTQLIEDQIRSTPEFWFWFHKRWKTRPPGQARH
jgi:KDO2-lipid IV(A) lauroyltransferase